MRPNPRRASPPRFITPLSLARAILLVAWGLIVPVVAHADPPNEEKQDPDETVAFPDFHDEIAEGLLGYVWRPDGPGPFPAVVALHGSGGAFADNAKITGKLRYYGKLLSDLGYLFLLVDSYTTRGAADDDDPGAPDSVLVRPLDAEAGRRYLVARAADLGDVDLAAGFALIGWSEGGSSTLSSVASAPQAPLVDAGVFTDPEDWLAMRQEGFRVAIALYPGCGQHGHYNDEYETYSVLRIFIGENDASVDPAKCEVRAGEAATAGSDIDLRIYPGEEHGYDYERHDQPAAVETRLEILTLLDLHLRGGPIFADGFESGGLSGWSSDLSL